MAACHLRLANNVMRPSQSQRDQRKSPRVDVLRHVEGQLVAIGTPIVIHDLSQTGFAVVSRLAFPVGATLDFRLVGIDGTTVAVTAEAVHTRPVTESGEMHLSGFRFVPGRLTGLLPQRQIDQLIEAVTPVTSCLV